jgi:hypothetical protein
MCIESYCRYIIWYIPYRERCVVCFGRGCLPQRAIGHWFPIFDYGRVGVWGVDKETLG